MQYIKQRILEILTALLVNDDTLSLKNDSLVKLSQFLYHAEKNRFIKFLDIKDKQEEYVVVLKDRIGLENFLKEYLDAYKNGLLEPDEDVNYLCYAENLSYAKDILIGCSRNFSNKNIVMSFKELRLKDENEKSRLCEFVLDVYFSGLTEDIEVTKYVLKYDGILRIYLPRVYINLKASPDRIYQLLINSMQISSQDKKRTYEIGGITYYEENGEFRKGKKEISFQSSNNPNYRLAVILFKEPNIRHSIKQFYHGRKIVDTLDTDRAKSLVSGLNKKFEFQESKKPFIRIHGADFMLDL